MKAKAGSFLHCHTCISYLEQNVKLNFSYVPSNQAKPRFVERLFFVQTFRRKTCMLSGTQSFLKLRKVTSLK